jgi:hypothetical protein
MFIAETSHYGTGRAAWLDEVARECALARAAGAPLEGVCLYPILDRHDWDDRTHWHNSGLWDLGPAPHYERRLNREYAEALARAQKTVGQHVGC